MLSFITVVPHIFSMGTINDDTHVCKCVPKMLNAYFVALNQSTFWVSLAQDVRPRSQTERVYLFEPIRFNVIQSD